MIGKWSVICYKGISDRPCPDSIGGRVSTSGAGGHRFDPRPCHTKGVTAGYFFWC